MPDPLFSRAAQLSVRYPVARLAALAGVALLALVCGWTGQGSAQESSQVSAAVLERLEGSWKGRGTIQQSRDGSAEMALCRIESKLSDEGRKLTTAGQCATKQTKVSISGTLRYLPATQSFTGTLFSRGDDGERTSSTGKANSDGLMLTITKLDAMERLVSRNQVTIKFNGKNGYALRVEVANPPSSPPYLATDMAFKRQ